MEPWRTLSDSHLAGFRSSSVTDAFSRPVSSDCSVPGTGEGAGDASRVRHSSCTQGAHRLQGVTDYSSTKQ